MPVAKTREFAMAIKSGPSGADIPPFGVSKPRLAFTVSADTKMEEI
jgi:hypothetical protein